MRLKFLFSVLLLALVSPALGSLQQGQVVSKSTPPAEDEETMATIRKRVDEVSVIFTVTDKRGRFVRDLKQEDFKLLDDRKPAHQVVQFRRETDLPLRVGVVIDISGSVRDKFHFEQQSAVQFLNSVLRRNTDRAFVMGFDVVPEVTQDWTDDPVKLAEAINKLRPGGGTALYDAVLYAAREKLLKRKETESVRRAMILISDGDDTQSRVTQDEALQMALRADVIIYCISTNERRTKTLGDKALERFALETGGRVFYPYKVEQASNAFADIEDELRSQYAIVYKPADFRADGRFRTIEISALTRNKLRVRARRGYYASAE